MEEVCGRWRRGFGRISRSISEEDTCFEVAVENLLLTHLLQVGLYELDAAASSPSPNEALIELFASWRKNLRGYGFMVGREK